MHLFLESWNQNCFGISLYIYLFIWGFTSLSTLYRSYHDGSWKGIGNQYIQLVKVLYCKLPTNGKQLSAFPLEFGPGSEPRSQRWEARVLHDQLMGVWGGFNRKGAFIQLIMLHI